VQLRGNQEKKGSRPRANPEGVGLTISVTALNRGSLEEEIGNLFTRKFQEIWL